MWQDATSALPTTSPHADAHILIWLTLLPRTFTHADDTPTHLTFQLPNWSCSLASMRHHGSRLLPFWGSEVHYTVSSSLLIFWDPQLTSDHLTQARVTLRPACPSERSPEQCCNLCIHLFSLRVPHESAHKVSIHYVRTCTSLAMASSLVHSDESFPLYTLLTYIVGTVCIVEEPTYLPQSTSSIRTR